MTYSEAKSTLLTWRKTVRKLLVLFQSNPKNHTSQLEDTQPQ